MTDSLTRSSIEVHTENGIEPRSEPVDWRRAAMIAVLVALAIVGALYAFVWFAAFADASAPGGCGGG